MSQLFSSAVYTQSNKRFNRLRANADKAARVNSNLVATPTGYDSTTGLFIATTVNGSEVQYSQGNESSQPNQISVSVARGSLIGFGDWR
jgi:hypothetical protein